MENVGTSGMSQKAHNIRTNRPAHSVICVEGGFRHKTVVLADFRVPDNVLVILTAIEILIS